MIRAIYSVVKDLDVAKREVVFAFAQFDNPDADKDVTFKGAFKKTMQEMGPKGSDRVAHLWGHEKKTIPPIGKVLDLWEDNEFAYARSKMLKSNLANDVLNAYEEKAIKEHSYWGQAINPEKNNLGGYNFKELRLMEVSTVIWGAQENARLVEMVKSGVRDPQELESYINDLVNFVKKGKATDEFMKDIELEILKLSDVVKSLRPQIAPEPINEGMSLAQYARLFI
jgi:HK97 family phage prohead protease